MTGAPAHEGTGPRATGASTIDLSNAFAGRTAAITGHTGFKGSWLAAWLHSLGAQVVGLSDRSPERGAFHDLQIEGRVESHTVDVRDAEDVAATLASAAPDVVFHLAAQPLVRAGWRDPAATFATNVMGTIHTVAGALACPSVQAIVVATTDKVYENRGHGDAFVETDRLGGHDPYSASKAAAEIALAPYRDPVHMGLAPRPLVSMRAGNVIGGGDWAADRLLPDIVRALSQGEPVRIRRPDAVRPWQHVLDCLWGYLLAAGAMLGGRDVADAYNLAPTAAGVSVLDVAQRAVAAWGAPESSIVLEPERSSAEATHLELDAGLALRHLGWSPKWPVDRSVEEAIRFYRSTDRASLGLAQIEAHMAAPPAGG